MLKFSGSSAYVFPKEWKDFDYAGMARGLQQENPELKRLIVVGGAVEGMHDFDAGVAAAAPITAADKSAHGSQRSLPDVFHVGHDR